MPGSGRFTTLLALALLCLLGASGAALGQEPAPPAGGALFSGVSQPPARLGVFLEPGCAVAPVVRGDCPAPPTVRGVVEGGPADLAGILPGDTLVALDGVSLRREAGRRRMAGLRSGVPVELEVGRSSGRSSVRVLPTVRAETVVFRTSGAAFPTVPGPAGSFSFRFKDDSGAVAEFHPAPEGQVAPRADAFVIFGQSDDGRFEVRVGEPGNAAFVDGEKVELGELRAQLEQLTGGLLSRRQGNVDVRVVVGPDTADADVRRLIVESPELARRLEMARDEALADARQQMGTIVRLHREMESRGEAPPAWRTVYRSDEAPGPLARAPRPTEGPGVEHRLAGAEFRPLTPDLAEYFDTRSGLLVLRVIPGTPAARLGLKGGDVVVEVAGHEDPDMSTFRRLVADAPASGIDVKWKRKGTLFAGRLAGD